MPNTFAGKVLVDPRSERDNRRRFSRPIIDELELANAIYVPSARWPARGWILLRRGDLNLINTYATNLQLILQDFAGSSLTLNNLTVVQARCVSRGNASDPNAIYLVELTDYRGILKNKWFETGLTKAFNVRSPAYPDQYYSLSLNGIVPFTWNTMVSFIWTALALGTYPGLPITPTGTPENFWYPGTCAWDALNDILDLIGCEISVDLTSIVSYGIVSSGAADAAYTALSAASIGALQDDLEYVDAGSGRVPGTVSVLFHRRNQYYGTEETVRNDTLQWATSPAYAITIAAPAQFASALGTHYIWDDFTIRYDIDNSPLVADVATATAIATQRVTQYYNHIYSGTVGYLNQTYAGLRPFRTGPLVDGVGWRQDFSIREGFVTQVVRGDMPPWPEIVLGR